MLAREAVEDGSANRDFDEVEDCEGEQNQDCVGEPGVEGNEVKALGDVMGVEQLEDVEMEKVEAIAALADEKKRPP